LATSVLLQRFDLLSASISIAITPSFLQSFDHHRLVFSAWYCFVLTHKLLQSRAVARRFS
jgi:hypothetical protein